MRKTKLVIIGALAALVLGVFGKPVFADNPCDYMDKSDPNYSVVCGGSNGEQSAKETVKRILETVYLYVGIIAAIVIIIGGVFYMTSQGDPAKLKRAKDTIMYAVIGLIVTILAFAITEFVLGALGANNDTSKPQETTSEESTEGTGE